MGATTVSASTPRKQSKAHRPHRSLWESWDTQKSTKLGAQRCVCYVLVAFAFLPRWSDTTLKSLLGRKIFPQNLKIVNSWTCSSLVRNWRKPEKFLHMKPLAGNESLTFQTRGSKSSLRKEYIIKWEIKFAYLPPGHNTRLLLLCRCSFWNSGLDDVRPQKRYATVSSKNIQRWGWA